MLTVTSTAIEAVKIVTPKSFADSRGVFCETYNRNRFFEHGIALEFIQDNHSSSVETGTIRGLHFQSPPAAQDKLIRVLRGSILDVAVDLRRSSPTYGKWTAEKLSATDGKQLLVPVGFAHGFCTLEPDTHVLYKVTAYYSPANDLGIAWDDPDLAIDWPVKPGKAILSEKDTRHPRFDSLPTYFE
jgi:dTDP-4-dehydrorhamnose 3,5-epimerase